MSLYVAVFSIFSPFCSSFIFTLNDSVALVSFGTGTLIPFAKSSSVYVVSSSFIFILFSTNVVPSGAVSCINAVPSTVPTFVAVSVYIICWSSITYVTPPEFGFSGVISP